MMQSSYNAEQAPCIHRVSILRKAYFSLLHVVSSVLVQMNHNGNTHLIGLGCFAQEAVIGYEIYDSRTVRVPRIVKRASVSIVLRASLFVLITYVRDQDA